MNPLIKQTHKKRTKTKVFILSLAVVLLMLLINVYSPTGFLLRDMFNPIFQMGGVAHQSLPTLNGYFTSKEKLLAEKEKLANEVEDLRLTTLDLEVFRYENEILRNALNLQFSKESIAAKVIARPPQILFDSLMVDKGIDDGLEEGDQVLASANTFLGNIRRLSNGTAILDLTSFLDKVTSGFVARTDELLEVKGVGSGNIKARVPIDFDVVVGDRIMREGRQTQVVALVRKIEENRSSGFKDVLMSLPLDVSKIRIVFITPNLPE